jgi:hypothetical protein
MLLCLWSGAIGRGLAWLSFERRAFCNCEGGLEAIFPKNVSMTR